MKTKQNSQQVRKLGIISILIFLLAAISCENDLTIDETGPEGVNKVTDGYVLFSFLGDKTTHLIDTNGNDVKTWTSSYNAVGGCYLTGNNTLLRSGVTAATKTGTFSSGGAATGIIEELDDESNVIWSFKKDDDNYTLHHDFKEIDENTIIALAWGIIEYNSKNYWDDKVIIIDKTSNTITWVWCVLTDGGIPPSASDKEDYIHFNSVDYKDGSVLVSSRNKNIVYLIDKESKAIASTFTAGGTLSGQHDASFLDNGNILVFNNNAGNSTSTAVEINTSDEVVWEYSNDFYSTNISGVQRLESGNTLICSGNEARFIEITSDGEEVWNYMPASLNSNKPIALFKARKYAEY